MKIDSAINMYVTALSSVIQRDSFCSLNSFQKPWKRLLQVLKIVWLQLKRESFFKGINVDLFAYRGVWNGRSYSPVHE